jgi:hypothetical protein
MGGTGIRTGLLGTAATLILATGAPDLHGQWRDDGFREGRDIPSAGWFSVSFITADPLGEFGELVDVGLGAELEGNLALTRDGAVSLRGDVGFIVYGHERSSVCLAPPVGCRINVDLTTSNSIFFAGIGPEFVAPTGALRPYVNASAGFSYFVTHSSLDDDDWDGDDDFGTTRNFDDFVGAFRVGGGLRARLRGGANPILLDLGVQYHRNGTAEYLREGDIVDHPDGSITLFPNRTEADLMVYRIGVTFGFPRGGGDHDRRRRR